MREITQLYKNENDDSGEAINAKEIWIKELVAYLNKLKLRDWPNSIVDLAEGKTIEDENMSAIADHFKAKDKTKTKTKQACNDVAQHFFLPGEQHFLELNLGAYL